MELSIIIVAYKNWKVLEECIKSIEEYQDLDRSQWELIVVDNSPEKERVDQFVKFDVHSNYKYIKSKNKGFGYGNNIGAKVSNGKFLAFLNPDTIMIEPILKKIINTFKGNTNISLLGIKLLNKDLSYSFSYFYDYQGSIFKDYIIRYCNKFNYFNERKMYIAGADLFIRRDVFFNIGMFDENIFMYYEEGDIKRRIKLLSDKNKIIYLPNCRMIHLEGKSTIGNINTYQIKIKSCIYIGKKYNLNILKEINKDLILFNIKKIRERNNTKLWREVVDIYINVLKRFEREQRG